MARYDRRGLGHAGSRAEDKKTRYGQETEKKTKHLLTIILIFPT